MRIHRLTCISLLSAVLPLVAGAQDVFRLSFHGSGRFINPSGDLQTRRVTTDDLIARCVGEAGLATNNQGTNRQFELVYNPAEDTVQVVNLTNGSFVCDVLQFQGGSSNVDRHHISRLAFVFIPEQNESVGSAILTDRIRNRADRLSLRGQIQFTLPSLELGSSAGAQFTTAPISTTNGVGTTNNLGSGSGPGGIGSGTNSSVTTNLPVTSPIVATPPPVGTNSTIVVTNNLSGAGNSGITNSLVVTPPLPGATTTSATNTTPGTATNSVVTIGSSSAALPPTPFGLTSGATNSIVSQMPGLAAPLASITTTNAAGTNALGDLTNGVICSGTFSVGRRIVIPGTQ